MEPKISVEGIREEMASFIMSQLIKEEGEFHADSEPWSSARYIYVHSICVFRTVFLELRNNWSYELLVKN
jgi:hypothetical protein